MVAWGLNNYGQTTVQAAALSGVTAIAAGAYHTVALKSNERGRVGIQPLGLGDGGGGGFERSDGDCGGLGSHRGNGATTDP